MANAYSHGCKCAHCGKPLSNYHPLSVCGKCYWEPRELTAEDYEPECWPWEGNKAQEEVQHG